MLINAILVISFFGSCFSQDFWDPEDPRCEADRASKKYWWDSERSSAKR